MTKKVIIAPVGDYIDDLYIGVRSFETSKVFLITPKEKLSDAETAKENLEKFKIPTTIVQVDGFIWEEIFRNVAKINEQESDEVIVNVSTGDRDSRCAATSAAFVNGLKAFGVKNNEPMMLPVLKFSYYNLLTDKKMELLQIVHDSENNMIKLEELIKKSKMSPPLVSYHINGTLKSDGLKQMGLVETDDTHGKLQIKLSFLGKMLLKGYIKANNAQKKSK